MLLNECLREIWYMWIDSEGKLRSRWKTQTFSTCYLDVCFVQCRRGRASPAREIFSAEDLQLWLQCYNRNTERADCASMNFCAEIQPKGNATVRQSRQNAATPRCVPQPTFTPVFIYIARPSCSPLIGFAWVMSTIDRKYNLIRSRERQRWDGRYWERKAMAINGTTPSQCSIMTIWFINYPWRWGFYLTRHANWQKRHTRAYALTKEGNIGYHGKACLPSVRCGAVWLTAGSLDWALGRPYDWQFSTVKTHTPPPPKIADLKYTHDWIFFFEISFRWRGQGSVGRLNAACLLLLHWLVVTSQPWERQGGK